MVTYYPMATYDGKTDNFHTLTTYDSQDTIDDCLKVLKTWISSGFKIDRMWIQEFENSSDKPKDIPVQIVNKQLKIVEKV